MTFREEIYSHTTSDGTVTGLIGTRLYPDRLPQVVTLPAVSYIAHVGEDDTEYRTHDVIAVPRTVTRVQFNCYAETGDEAAEVADAVEAAWNGHQDLPAIGGSWVANRVDTYEPGFPRHQVILDIQVERER